jgi:dolichol-phosphate mannosyltransferase
MTSVSVLVPVYNNEVTIEELWRRLVASLDPLVADFEVIFVNDGSSDRSWSIITSLAAADRRCVGIQLSRNFGQHPAIGAGLERCRGDLTVLMDADLQDRPEELPKLLAAFEDPDVEIVYTTWEMGTTRASLTSRLFHSVFARLAGLEMPSNVGTYRAFSASVRAELLRYQEQGAVYGPLMSQMGFEYRYVTVQRDRPGGRKTSYNFRRRLALAVNALIAYSDLPHRLVTWTGLTFTLGGLVYLAVLVAQYAVGNRPLQGGITLLIGITVLMSGVLLMSVGVLTAYVYRVFHEVLGRPRYHIARQVGVGLESPTS